MLLHARNHYTQSLQLQPEPRYSSVQQALTRPRAARGLSASSDSKFFQHRFQIASFAAARCEGDMVQLLPCTIMRSKSLVNYCLVQGSSCTISPSQRRTSVLMCKSSAQALHGRRLANDSQYHISRKFYLQTPPNRRPNKLRSDELPTGRIGLALRAPNRNLSRFEPSGITQVNRDKCEHRGTK